jgi:chromosome segregation protein
MIASASQAIAALGAEQHRQEKTVVSCEAHLHRAEEEVTRLKHRTEQLDRERRQAEEERDALDRRQDEARTSIARLEDEQRAADARLTGTQRRLFEAREAAESLSRRAAEAGASHAALVEREAGFEAEVARLEEGFAELDRRAGALAGEVAGMRERAAALQASLASGEMRLDADVRSLDGLRLEVRTADDAVSDLRARADRLDGDLKSAREALESVRMFVASLDVERATTEGALAHLAQAAVDAVQATLDDIVAEVAALEAAGTLGPDARVVCAPDVEEVGDEGDEREDDVAVPENLAVAAEQALGAEEAITRLREKIERLGPVNMMAIEQFDELEARHTFLDTQRRDLVDSIAQTSQAIRRIDETTRQRFSEAFSAINRNFQETFSTLFGGGRAGLTLLDENDPLESGIEIIAQPPGKRLQSVQLLSGGEKALTAIALMFGLFKFKPSPFCLLDEIDAPLDDANIGRFVEMLRGMQRHTQFILITHNRKTMEIADRLYGVTMEEPGVSKLISVQLN